MRTLYGPRMADFHPQHHSKESLIETVRKARALLGRVSPRPVQRVFAPRVSFSNRVVSLGQEDAVWASDFIRTQGPADGGIVTSELTAVAIFNADCPVVCLYTEDRLAVLHTGFRCLVRANPRDPHIIEVGMRFFPADRPRAWIGYGIGPCCWVPGLDDKPEVLDTRSSRYPDLLGMCLARTTAASPFGPGNLSVNLYGLAFGLLLEVGIPEEAIRIDDRCTCCHVQAGDFLYWSHTRYKKHGGVDGRNLAMLWLDSSVSDQWPDEP